MRFFSLWVALFALITSAAAQTSYTGFIDKYPVELVTEAYSDGFARAIYVYTHFDEPIVLDGTLRHDSLLLYEKDRTGRRSASLLFPRFTADADSIEGSWTNLVTGKSLVISLRQKLKLPEGENTEAPDQEVLQSVSLPGKYFKLVLSKTKDDFSSRVTGVKIYEKKTDRLLQELKVDCQMMGLDNIDTGDFNFDGKTDFSVFESSYAGPNTSSLYFLWDARTNTFFESGFTGTSLEFDAKTKTIHEHNQCCAGSQVTTADYKVVKNKMVLIRQRCFKWNEKKGELTERRWEECR